MRHEQTLRRIYHRTPAERAKIVERFLRSDLSRVAFARTHGFSVASLNRWLAEIAPAPAADPGQVFREVQLLSPTSTHAWAVEIVGPSGTTIRLQQCPPVEDLVRLLGVSC